MYNLYTISDCCNKCILINKYGIILSMLVYSGIAVRGTMYTIHKLIVTTNIDKDKRIYLFVHCGYIQMIFLFKIFKRLIITTIKNKLQ